MTPRMMRSLACTFAAGLFLTGGNAFARQGPLAVEDVLKAPTLAAFSAPSLSPDNRFLAYVVTDNARRRDKMDRDEVTRQGLAWYGLASDVWVTDLKTGAHRNVTGGGHNWAPSWSPDGRRLAFLADRSGGPTLGPARLWVWDGAAGTLRQVSDADVREGFAGIHWVEDGRSILVSLFPEHLGRNAYAARLEGRTPQATHAAGVTARVFEFIPAAPAAVPSTDQVNLDIWLRDLGVIDVDTGVLRRVVTGLRIGRVQVSPDRWKIAYTVLLKPEKPGAGQYLYRLVIQDLATGEKRAAAEHVRFTLMANSFSWSPASDSVAWRTGGPLADDEVYVAPAGGGTSRRVAKNPPTDTLQFDVEPPVWDAPARHVYFTRDGALWRAAADSSGAVAFAKSSDRKLSVISPQQQRLVADRSGNAVVQTTNPATKRTGFARVSLSSGAMHQLIEEEKRYGGYGTDPGISPDGTTIAFVAEDPSHPADLYLLEGDWTKPRRVSQVALALANRAFGRAEAIEWRTLDGETLHGALVYPAHYEPGRTYPLIVKVYGGSSISNDLFRFGYASAPIENLQLYASRGFALLLADSSLHVGSPMVDLMKSVMPGINKAVELGVADPDRIGVMGHSYGGYSTLSLIVQSRRFKAAVARAGMGDLFSGYGQLAPDGTNYGLAWSETGQGRMGGHPWEFRERYLENSPMFYLDRVETPLLIIHGSVDTAVPAFLADQVFTGLRRLGKPVTYARYEGEEHWEGGWSYPNQVDSVSRILAWFEKHLKARTTSY